MFALRRIAPTEWFGTAGNRLRFRQPENQAVDVIPLDESGAEAAHFLTFTIDVEDIL